MSVDSGADSANCKIRRDISVAPWYNITQFKKVYENLYSSEVAKKRWAVDEISVWETRCHPSLPTAVEASQVLARAVIQDILLTNGASLCQERDIQMMYAMALVRFVNLTVEAHQKLLQDFSTTSQVAKGIGIPPWVVELRNEATHSFLPSLPSLRMAAEAAMKYISESFWEKEIGALRSLEKEPFDETNLRNLIISYIKVQFQMLEEQERKQPSDKAAENKLEFNSILRKILLALRKHKKEFNDVLVSVGFFIPCDDDFRIMLSREERVQYEEVYDREKPPDTFRSLPHVPPILVDMWRPLLKVMNRMQVVPLFLETLLKSQADHSDMGQKLVMAWVQKILKIHTMGMEDASLREVFKQKGLVVNGHRLFHAAISRPCIYILYILPLIFSCVNLSERTSRYSLNLLAIILGHGNWKKINLSSKHSIYTVENLKQMKKVQEAARKPRRKQKSEEVWSIPEDSSYKSWPIGHINNPIEEEDEAGSQSEDFISLEDFDDKEDDLETCFLGTEDIEVENLEVVGDPNAFDDDEMDLCERETFVYKKK